MSDHEHKTADGADEQHRAGIDPDKNIILRLGLDELTPENIAAIVTALNTQRRRDGHQPAQDADQREVAE
jgi:hypothetical protein